jgi:perosamine synthetase
MKKIPYAQPSITELEKKYVCDAIENGWGASCYDYIYKFQDSFSNYLGVEHAIATSSCTGALHIALKTLGIKAEDEVIVPDATWIASVAPITYLCATPVLVDILESTWCIDPMAIQKAITPKTKAIIAVHLYGNMCEMDEIMQIAKEHNLYVIEDAAEAIGSEYKGKKAGTMGDFGVFSFHGTKTITTGEGGMLVTNNSTLFEKASILHDHGRNPRISKMFWADKIGFKYKISNIQAALGYAQVERIEELVAKKIEIFNLYKKEFSNIAGVRMNFEQTYVKNSYWMPTIILDESLKIERDELISYLQKKHIDARVFFHPISSLDFFNSINNKNAYSIGRRGINLPSYFSITKKDIINISHIIKTKLDEDLIHDN